MLLFKRAITLFVSLLAFKLVAQEYAILRDISYYEKNIVDGYKSERCKLDLYYPKPIIDRFAPLYQIRVDAPPIVLYTGGPELEMIGRAEENAYMMRMLKVVGHKNVNHVIFESYDHRIQFPALTLVVEKIKQLTQNENNQ